MEQTDLDQLRAYLLSKPGAVEDLPFGPSPLVVKAGGKMFALLSLGENPLHLSLKCDPTHAQMLRDAYPAVTPGYHLNKRHWNTVVLDGSVPNTQVRAMIDESYALVVKGLTRAAQKLLATPIDAGE